MTKKEGDRHAALAMTKFTGRSPRCARDDEIHGQSAALRSR